MLFQTNINHAYYAIGQSESVSKFIIVEQFELLSVVKQTEYIFQRFNDLNS